MKSTITVSRKWNNPSIMSFVDIDQVGSTMTLESFLDACLVEMGNPTLLFTKAQLAVKLKDAATAVVDEMKRSTVHV